MSETQSPQQTISGTPEPWYQPHLDDKQLEKPQSQSPPPATATSSSPLFKNKWQQAGFVAAIMFGQCFNLTPFGATLGSRWLIAEDLGVPGNPGQIGWIAAGFSLTTGSFVLVGGRLGDIYGHRVVWMTALVWEMIWNLVSGFARSPAFFDACRGLTGIGAGIMLPTAVALLSSAYPPGRNRNLAFGLFGALAPFSAAGGAVFEVMLAQLVNPQWIWWLHALKNVLTLLIAYPSIPAALAVGLGGTVDWIGAFLGVSGLILFNFAFNQAPLDGWAAASVIAPLVVGFALFFVFAFWEMKVAKSPILPFDIWRAPTFLAVISSAFLCFMAFGIFVYYDYQFLTDFRGATPLQLVAYFVPFTVDGFIAACLAAFLISRVPAQVIFCVGALSVAISSILVMTAHPQGTYWTATFWASVIAPFGPDLTFTAAQLVASNTVKRSEQGVAGSLVGTVLNYGLALGIGLGGTVEAHTNGGGSDELGGLRGALYLAVGMAGLAIFIVLVFVRIPKDRREGYDDEVGEIAKEKVEKDPSQAA